MHEMTGRVPRAVRQINEEKGVRTEIRVDQRQRYALSIFEIYVLPSLMSL
jgi:hypothetical protein